MAAYTPDRDAKRLLPDLSKFPPNRCRVLYHPDVQLTTEEWLELKDYEKKEMPELDPGTVALQEFPQPMTVNIPLHVSRYTGI